MLKKFGIIGNPVNHSKSPALMNAAFHVDQFDAKYLKLASNTVGEAIQTMKKLGFEGANVTSPYKSAVLTYIDELDEASSVIGSVNTILFENGIVKAFNTDYLGVVNALMAKNIVVKDKNILVIGAGGAGKAAVYGLQLHSKNITVINRTYTSARHLARKYQLKCAHWQELNDAIPLHDIIINTIPHGQFQFENASFNAQQVLFDANYYHSQFQEIAKEKQCEFIDGKQWLLHQAYPAYKLFTNKEAAKDAMQAKLEASSVKNNLALIGFMGSGKSSIGKSLAKKMHYKFVDIDKEIEKKEKKLIVEIFEKKGEKYFRELEHKMLKKICKNKQQVISCGGGIVLHKGNRKLLQEHSQIIWLFADIISSIRRLKNNKRPLLNVENKAEKAVNLFNERKNYYAATADIILNTTNFNKAQLTNKLYEEISFSI